MLKIEKTSQLSGLTIRLRERERFFEPRLLKAFAFALILHIGGFLFFHITPFSFNSSFTFPPVQVQSDQPIQTISAIANHSFEEAEEFFPPPLSMIPPLEIAAILPPPSLTPSLSLNPHIFQSVEEHLWPFWQAPLSLKLEEPRIRLTISGELIEQKLVAADSVLDETLPITLKTTPAYASYRVQMHEETGELFWIERIESSGIPSIDALTEKIAFNLRFAPTESLDALQGTLNFIVLVPQFQASEIP